MLPVFSWQITSTSKDKGTHYLYMVKGPVFSSFWIMIINNAKKIIKKK